MASAGIGSSSRSSSGSSGGSSSSFHSLSCRRRQCGCLLLLSCHRSHCAGWHRPLGAEVLRKLHTTVPLKDLLGIKGKAAKELLSAVWNSGIECFPKQDTSFLEAQFFF
jgi:hypothetical protein